MGLAQWPPAVFFGNGLTVRCTFNIDRDGGIEVPGRDFFCVWKAFLQACKSSCAGHMVAQILA